MGSNESLIFSPKIFSIAFLFVRKYWYCRKIPFSFKIEREFIIIGSSKSLGRLAKCRNHRINLFFCHIIKNFFRRIVDILEPRIMNLFRIFVAFFVNFKNIQFGIWRHFSQNLLHKNRFSAAVLNDGQIAWKIDIWNHFLNQKSRTLPNHALCFEVFENFGKHMIF